MERQEWIEKVRLNKDKLRAFVDDWHPSNVMARRAFGVKQDQRMPITAPNPEAACEFVRRQIAEKEEGKGLEEAAVRFDKALETEDVGELNTLLNSAWFGVPESTSCWSIPGFSEVVDLIEDTPEPTDEEMERYANEAE